MQLNFFFILQTPVRSIRSFLHNAKIEKIGDLISVEFCAVFATFDALKLMPPDSRVFQPIQKLPKRYAIFFDLLRVQTGRVDLN